LNPSIGKVNGLGPDNFVAGSDTEAAENTVIVWIFSLEATPFDTEISGEVLDRRRLGTSGQEKFDQDLAGAKNPLRMGPDLDSFPHRIVAGCDQPRLPVLPNLHGAKPASALGCEVRVVAERWNRDGHLSGDVQKGGILLCLYPLSVNG